ncbi:MAG: divergent PAP2 family protein [Clostridia bacterium]|nr:divergent PAP2 family protein [Clostridia bacterium]
MNYFLDFLDNKALLAALTAWFTAQVIKIIINLIQEKKIDFALLMSSGGMPSSHSATVCSLAVMIMRICSAASIEFALASVFAFVVMYDAAGVRRAAGEQAKVLNRIVEDLAKGKTEYMEKNLKELIGHTPFQVTVGAVLGIIIGATFPV